MYQVSDVTRLQILRRFMCVLSDLAVGPRLQQCNHCTDVRLLSTHTWFIMKLHVVTYSAEDGHPQYPCTAGVCGPEFLEMCYVKISVSRFNPARLGPTEGKCLHKWVSYTERKCQEIVGIPAHMLQHVFHSLKYCIHLSIDTNGSDCQHLHKDWIVFLQHLITIRA